jgi:hypothetical protein
MIESVVIHLAAVALGYMTCEVVALLMFRGDPPWRL